MPRHRQNLSQHLSDDELLLAADGEPGRKALPHLETCPRCRARAAQFESTIADLAHAQRNALDSALPSIAGPRALLRARMSELSRPDAGIWTRLFFPARLLARTAGAAALVAVAAFAGLVAMRHSRAALPPPPLLSSDAGVLPNRAFTPGAARQAALAEVCALPHEEVVSVVPESQRRKVLEEYGIPAGHAGDYELDYLITPGLGGDDDIRNLWPQPHRAAWNADAKDILEERLHQMVCSHQLDLSVAQQAIATDWIAAYKKYVETVPPNARAARASSVAEDLGSIIFVHDAEPGKRR
jgi:hypothetical protein